MIAFRNGLAHLTLAMPLALAAPAKADALPGSPVESIEVTATRTPEPAASIPASVTIISGQELRDRNVTDQTWMEPAARRSSARASSS